MPRYPVMLQCTMVGPEVNPALKAIAARRGVRVSDLVREAMHHYLSHPLYRDVVREATGVEPETVAALDTPAPDFVRAWPITLGFIRERFRNSPDRIVVDPFEADIVRQVFAQWEAGVRPADIARNLNRAGLKTREGGPWDFNTVRNITRKEFLYRPGYVDKHGVEWPPILPSKAPDAADERLEKTAHLQIDMTDRQVGGRRGKS